MELLARSNLSDQIIEIIGKRIVRNELKPGEPIVETQISKELGVSRSPVRDALRMLEHIRLVDRTPKGGYQVTEFSVELVQSLYETAVILYQFAFAKAAEKATRKDLMALKEDLADLERSSAGKDFDLYLVSVTKMAHNILRISGNPIVERIARELMPTAERVQWAAITYLPDQLKAIVGHLRHGYECIANKDPEGAAKSFEDFATSHVQVVLNSLDQPRKQTTAK